MGGTALTRERAAVLVIDVQEKLCAAMPATGLERVLNRTRALLEGAAALKLPIAATEQYPKGLGASHPALRPLLPHPPIEKLQFSAVLPQVLEQLGGRDQVIVAGMEGHVCVYQTVRDLAGQGKQVFLMTDAVISRAEADLEVGRSLCADAGARLYTVETALFELLRGADAPEFRAISKAIR